MNVDKKEQTGLKPEQTGLKAIIILTNIIIKVNIWEHKIVKWIYVLTVSLKKMEMENI